jgi:hypothetical protein
LRVLVQPKMLGSSAKSLNSGRRACAEHMRTPRTVNFPCRFVDRAQGEDLSPREMYEMTRRFTQVRAAWLCNTLLLLCVWFSLVDSKLQVFPGNEKSGVLLLVFYPVSNLFILSSLYSLLFPPSSPLVARSSFYISRGTTIASLQRKLPGSDQVGTCMVKCLCLLASGKHLSCHHCPQCHLCRA